MAKLKASTKTKAPKARSAAAASDDTAQNKAEQLSRSIMDSAQHIWLAGMGAFNRAQAEGTKMFESLVSEGMTLEQRTRKLATGRVDAVRDAMESKVGQVKDRATDTWDRLEKVFEDRVQRALVRLGVPGRDDLKALIERVDRLNAELRKLSSPPAKKSAGKTPAAKKSASKAAPKPAAKAAAKPAPTAKAAKTPRKAAAKAAAAPAPVETTTVAPTQEAAAE